MTLTNKGAYWLAEGQFIGRLILAEGTTRREAREAWEATARRDLHDPGLRRERYEREN